MAENSAGSSPCKRIAVAVVGGLVTLIGIALLVLPGPAFIVIPIGLSILATQFDWPKKLLEKARGLGGGRAGQIADCFTERFKKVFRRQS